MSNKVISRQSSGAAVRGRFPRRYAGRRLRAALTGGLLLASVSACAHAESANTAPVGIGIIIKTSTNPFFMAIKQGAEERAATYGMKPTVSSGSRDGDVDSQIAAIEAAITRGDRAILITPNGQAVDGPLKRARKAGIFVVALDTRPTDPAAADITFATDNFEAGRLTGAWAAEKMRGQPVVIAMLDLFVNRAVESDFNRDQGFLEGMGIPLADPTKNGDEPSTGDYRGGTYRIACHEATFGAKDEGAAAMEKCLRSEPAINLVYTINEPAASGASDALRRAGRTATMVSVDGGCDPGMQLVRAGVVGATAQQYPREMATQGIDAIADYLEDGTRPLPNHGIDMVTTGVSLVTDDPQPGVPSVDVAEGLAKCWGNPS